MTRRKLLAGIPLTGALLVTPTAAVAAPTCADTLEIANHGHHVVADYVTGTGHSDMAWPPDGQVGSAISGEGAVVPGGPGPGFHFENGIAPGASFCTESQSPGTHL